MLRDSDGRMIDFQWPPFFYWVKAGAAATIGVLTVLVVAWVPMLLLYLLFLGGLVRAALR
jgi:hypothetical protein